ncbi:hypothetical protein [Brevifollis gellanilyticus]|uniref:Uncharacterized protein n=1 Tax=Brevifollis gellanilyticus TaxID=748831 RepID=A0A512MC95_9BACT|nr:hypothetical protein [Brevifollis gellanilyticus]GEP44358.1 hypothetical protein BGE01nite_36490 [Brevifollis gellanilyticus]
MSAITIDSAELQSLIRSAVNEAFQAHLDELQSDWDDETTDGALARAMDEVRYSPRMSSEEFLKRLNSAS